MVRCIGKPPPAPPLSRRGITRSSLTLALLGYLFGSAPLFAQEGLPLSAGVGGLVSVKDVGAKGDGVADDTAAIQRAMGQFTQNFKGTAASRTIYFPAGTYIIRQPLI